MSFFDRIKSGANKASERAQSVMEVNKLNSQISNIEHEMTIYYQQMGQVFYEGYRAKDMSQAEKEMMELAKTCDLLAEERDEVRTRVAALRNERLCECGKVVPQEAVFCPYCGRKLKARSNRENTVIQTEEPVSKKEEQIDNETAVTDETMIYRGPLVKEEPGEKEAAPLNVDQKRLQEELDRERERQQELDRRIRTWKENMISPKEEQSASIRIPLTTEVKCQICAATLAKGTRWCPHCGAEQI